MSLPSAPSTAPMPSSSSAAASIPAKEEAPQSQFQFLSESEIKTQFEETLKQIQRNETKSVILHLPGDSRCYRTAEPLTTFTDPSRGIRCMAARGTLLATGSVDGSIRLWDTTAKNKPFVLAEREGISNTQRPGIQHLTFMPNSNMLASATDMEVKLWNAENASCVASRHSERAIASLAVFPDNNTIACGHYDDISIELWDVKQDKTQTLGSSRLFGHYKAVTSLAVLPDRQLAYLTIGDTKIGIFDCSTTSPRESDPLTIPDAKDFLHPHSLFAIDNGCLTIGFGNTLGISDGDILGNTNFPVGVIDAKAATYTTLGTHTDQVKSLARLPSGLIVSEASDLKFWDLASEQCLLTWPNTGHCLATLPGDTIAIAKGNKIELLKPDIADVLPLSIEQARSIVTALQNNTSVTDLDFADQPQIDDRIIDPIIGLLKPGFFSWRAPNTTLKTIDLRNTKVTKAGIERLQKVIQKNHLAVTVQSNFGLIADAKLSVKTEAKVDRKATATESKAPSNPQLMVAISSSQLALMRQFEQLEKETAELKAREATLAAYKTQLSAYQQQMQPSSALTAPMDAKAIKAIEGKATELQALIAQETTHQLATRELQEINRSDSLKIYYFTCSQLLRENWFACSAIHSGKVANDEKSFMNYFAEGAVVASHALPGISLIANLFKTGLQLAQYPARRNAVNKIAAFFATIVSMEDITCALARQLALSQRALIESLATRDPTTWESFCKLLRSIKDSITVNDIDTPIKKLAELHCQQILTSIITGALTQHPNITDIPQMMTIILKDSAQAASVPVSVPVSVSSHPSASSMQAASISAASATIVSDSTLGMLHTLAAESTLSSDQSPQPFDATRILELEARLRQMEERAQKAEADAKAALREAERARQDAKNTKIAVEQSGIAVGGGGQQQLMASATASANPEADVISLDARLATVENHLQHVTTVVAQLAPAAASSQTVDDGTATATRTQLFNSSRKL